MAAVQEHLNLQMQKIRETLPKQILQGDSSEGEDHENPDDSLHGPDYNPEGDTSSTDDGMDGIDDKQVSKKKKKLQSKKGTENVDENNNCTIKENYNVCFPLESSLTGIQEQGQVDKAGTTPTGGIKRKKLSKKAERKEKRNKGEQYETAKGKIVPERRCHDFECLCPLKCKVVPFEWRKKAFDTYYSCGSWDLQTAYINAHVRTFDVDRRYVKGSPSKSRRQKSRHFYLDTDSGPKRVCKNVFIKTLDINSSRIHRILEKLQGDSFNDLRGKHDCGHKTKQSTKEHVMNHIQSFLTYSSHYCRSDTEKLYLSPQLSLQRMYDLYQTLCKDENLKAESMSIYANIFHTEFNFSFKIPSKDTCKTCDKLNIKIRAETNKPESQRDKIKLSQDQEEQERHLRESKNARNTLNSDKSKPKSDKTICVITFDLQKTLPTPKIPTSVAYYKRQLWVYNLGIHAYQNDDEHVYVA